MAEEGGRTQREMVNHTALGIASMEGATRGGGAADLRKRRVRKE